MVETLQETTASKSPPLAASALDLDKFIDERPFSRFHINLTFWPFVVLLADGFDLVVMGFAVPGIVKAWGIDRASMGPVLSASLVGMLIGTPILGYLGDRFGRRPLIIASLLLFGLATWATVLATRVDHLVALRFIAGVGLAGVIPNTTALVTEYSPRRVRGSLLVAFQSGVQVGSILPGLVSAYLVSTYGWHILFHIGGLWPIMLAFVLMLVLPESIKYLALRRERRADLVKMVRKIDPLAQIDENTNVTTAASNVASSLSPGVAFRFGMQIITPLLWGLVIVSLFLNLLILSWAPSVLQDLGLDAQGAALTASLWGLGGVCGSIILIVFFNKFGFLCLVGFNLVAIAAMASIGQPFLPKEMLPFVFFLTGICVSGPQSALNSALGMLYPTPIRANSAGWGIAIGRIGSIAGPLAGGFLLARHYTGKTFFEMATLPLILGLILAIALTILCHARFRSWSLNDRAA